MERRSSFNISLRIDDQSNVTDLIVSFKIFHQEDIVET